MPHHGPIQTWSKLPGQILQSRLTFPARNAYPSFRAGSFFALTIDSTTFGHLERSSQASPSFPYRITTHPVVRMGLRVLRSHHSSLISRPLDNATRAKPTHRTHSPSTISRGAVRPYEIVIPPVVMRPQLLLSSTGLISQRPEIEKE
jgi:hypothetical protein